MEPSTSPIALAGLFESSRRPIYVVDPRRRVIYCNAALADWLGLDPGQIVGRYVEYHSLAAAEGDSLRPTSSPLTGLCPPPRALAGEQCRGTVGSVARGGRLVHRQADFIPISAASGPAARSTAAVAVDGELASGVLVVLAEVDLSPDDLSAELSAEPSGDELHRAIRRFRREQSAEHAIESLLGESSAMRRVRAQVVAAAASRANVLVRGRRGSGRAHVARAIHYQSSDAAGRLLAIDCEVANEDLLRRTLHSLAIGGGRARDTLLAENLELLPPALQSQLLPAVRNADPHVRFVATLRAEPGDDPAGAAEIDAPVPAVAPPLLDALSTITIDVPRLADRPDDLPLLTQSLVESLNRASAKQIGSVHPEALDLLALYSWPGELDELRSVMAIAHAAATTHEIGPGNLPAVIHHAARAAALPRRAAEKIVLDELLASVEREVITRAMTEADGNKSAAAELLGMTRPRLYRRLVQLGLAKDSAQGEDA